MLASSCVYYCVNDSPSPGTWHQIWVPAVSAIIGGLISAVVAFRIAMMTLNRTQQNQEKLAEQARLDAIALHERQHHDAIRLADRERARAEQAEKAAREEEAARTAANHCEQALAQIDDDVLWWSTRNPISEEGQTAQSATAATNARSRCQAARVTLTNHIKLLPQRIQVDVQKGIDMLDSLDDRVKRITDYELSHAEPELPEGASPEKPRARMYVDQVAQWLDDLQRELNTWRTTGEMHAVVMRLPPKAPAEVDQAE